MDGSRFSQSFLRELSEDATLTLASALCLPSFMVKSAREGILHYKKHKRMDGTIWCVPSVFRSASSKLLAGSPWFESVIRSKAVGMRLR